MKKTPEEKKGGYLKTSEKYTKDELPGLKEMVEKSYAFDQQNYETYKYFNRFTYDTTLDGQYRAKLAELERPELEFNVSEPFVSRLLGEFDKHEPAISARSAPGHEIDPKVIEVVEGHIRHEVLEANKRSNFQHDSFNNIISGGFTSTEVWVDYAHDRSFEKVIRFGQTYDPTLDGYDPLSMESHKGDGKYAFSLRPRLAKDVAKKYGIKLDNVDFTRASANMDGFNWAYNDNKDDILLECRFYLKKKKPAKIVLLADEQVMLEGEYKEFLEQWEASGNMAVPPAVIDSRETEITTVIRYVFITNHILERTETASTQLLLVQGEGNARNIHEEGSGNVKRKKRPLIYNTVGFQKLLNQAGQTMSNELQNITQQRLKIVEEALPDQKDFLEMLLNPQKQNLIITKGFKDGSEDIPLPQPVEVQRQPIPPEVSGVFTAVPQLMQAALGSYDAEQGGSKDLSGKAIFLGAMQSNASSKPFLTGYLNMLGQVARIYVELLPKYYKTPRTIPIVGVDGKRQVVKINQEGGVKFDYDPNALEIVVEAGPSFSMLKADALKQLIFLSEAIPAFGEFITAKGLEIVLDNIEIKGIEHLKVLAGKFQQEMAQQKQQQMQMAQQAQMNNPLVMRAQNEAKRIENEARKDEMDTEIEVAKVGIDEQLAEIKRIEVLAKVDQSQAQVEAAQSKAQAENIRSMTDLMIKGTDMSHKHAKEAGELAETARQARHAEKMVEKAANKPEANSTATQA